MALARHTHDTVRMASHARGTFWFVIPSLPMFLLIPFLLDRGVGFWGALAIGCLATVLLYATMTALAPQVGISL
jgi:hypothetical protein